MKSAVDSFDYNVFINCPFDREYQPLFDSIVFTIMLAGFLPRCAKEDANSGQVRVDKILKIIGQCRYGIHDISRTEPDPLNHLPRFNMPLELGMDLACQRFGARKLKKKVFLVLDSEKFRYQKFISDLSGLDPEAHKNRAENTVRIIRDWLSSTGGDGTVPGGEYIFKKYTRFRKDLPKIQQRLKLDRELNYRDFVNVVRSWLDAAEA